MPARRAVGKAASLCRASRKSNACETSRFGTASAGATASFLTRLKRGSVPMSEQTEKHLGRPALEKLLKALDVRDSEVGAANGLASAAMEKSERAGLNKFAFGVARKLYKQDPVKAAHNIRALMLYIDLLGLEAQTDIEDAIKEQDKADERD